MMEYVVVACQAEVAPPMTVLSLIIEATSAGYCSCYITSYLDVTEVVYKLETDTVS